MSISIAGIRTGNPGDIAEVGGVLYFSANGDDESLPGYGVTGIDRELWKYDPSTSTGAVLVADINESRDDSSYPYSLTEVGGVLYFIATDGGKVGYQVWQYNPNSTTGPVPLGDINDGRRSRPGYLTEVEGVLYFSAIGKTADGEETGRELWRYDPGSSAGPVLVGDINVGIGDSDPFQFTEVEGVLYFIADDGVTGRELWKYDPSSSIGPVLVVDIIAGAEGSDPSSLTEVGGILYFNVDDGVSGEELWQYDPSSSAGPVLVVDIYDGSKSSSPGSLIEMDGNLYFSADDGIHGRELWGLINQSPVAVNDSYSLDTNSTYIVESPGVLSNDNSADVNIVSTILDATVSHGTLVLNSNGSFSYTPELGFSGVDSFSYHNSDGTDTSGSATVTLTVNSLSTNHPPVANAGADQLMIEATGIDTDVTLDGSGTTDADSGDSITYLWSWTINSVAYSASGISPVISLPLGEQLITLMAFDQKGAKTSDIVTVSIVDTTAPTIRSLADIIVEVDSLNEEVVIFSLPVANDLNDPNPMVSCTASSGDIFAIGQTLVTCTATDARGNSSSTSFVVTVKDTSSTIESLWIPIETGSDDAEEMGDYGRMSLLSSDLELIQDSNNSQLVGLRFHLDIPAGAIILTANIQFTVDETSSEPVSLTLSVEATDNALTFNKIAYDISSRPLLVASIPWAPPAWNLRGEAGPNQQTPDLSTIVQGIVDQDLWVQGNSIAFIISGNGGRVVESFEGTAAAVLNVTFHTDRIVPLAPDAVDDGSPMAVAYTTDLDQPLIVPSGGSDIVQRNDHVGFPVAEVSSFDEISAKGGLVSVNPDGSFSYSPVAGFEGVDSFSYTLENSEGSDSAITYIGVRNVTRIQIPVITGSDDAEEDISNGKIRLNSSDLELSREGFTYFAINQQVGVRFQGLAIPSGATITEAYIQYTADDSSSEPTKLTMYGEASADAMTFNTMRFDISNRLLTDTQVLWTPEVWIRHEQSSRTKTPDISTIVQEIINQDGWLEGNAIAFITIGDGQRIAKSFDRIVAPVSPPVLHVAFSTKMPGDEQLYAIGDTGPGGGIVFYTSNGGVNGLEVSPENQGKAIWGCYATTRPAAIKTDANGTVVGTGVQNTADILAACNEAGIAAEIADQYEVNNVTDWFLPATDEALLMYEQRVLLGLNANFWTSTENSAYSAFYIRLSQGDARTGNKNVLFDVWPIRAF